MNLFEALHKLDKVNTPLKESTNIEAYKQLMSEIEALEQEIKELDSKKAGSWDAKFEAKLKDSYRELRAVEAELDAVVKSYTYRPLRWADENGHIDEIEIDEKKKEEVAEQEAEIRQRLDKLYKDYYELKDSVQKEHNAEFKAHDQEVAAKRSTVASNKTKQAETVKVILEEERAELEGLCAKINDYCTVTPQWDKFTIYKGNLILRLRGESFETEVEEDDFDDNDSFKEEAVLERIAEKVEESDNYYEILSALGIDVDNLDWSIFSKSDPIDIPGSSWKFDPDVDIDIVGKIPEVYEHWYDSGDYWNPPEGAFEFDDYVEVQATYYLVKPI